MKNKPVRHKETNTFKFQPFSERISKLDIDVFHRIGHKNEEYNEEETFFYQTLQKWNVLNLSECYEELRKELPPVQTLPMLLNQQDVVIDVLLKHLSKQNRLALEAVLDLLAALMKDLRHEIYSSYGNILQKLCELLSTKDADELEWTFTCLAYMFKYLWRYIIKDLDAVFDSLIPLFSDNKPQYIKNFAAESFAYVARKVKNKKDFIKLILKSLESRSDSVQGCGYLLFEVLRGIRGRFHSFAQDLLPLVFEMLYDPSVNSVLLYNVLKHTVGAMCSSIDSRQFSLVWITVFQVLDKFSLNCSEVMDAQVLILKLVKQIVDYKEGVFLVELQHITPNILKLIDGASDETILTHLLEILASILLAPNVHLSQESAHQLTNKALMVPNDKIVVNFICLILEYTGFETFILPWVQNHACKEIRKDLSSSSVTLNKAVFNLLLRIVLQKAPLSIHGICLEKWKQYPLDLMIAVENEMPVKKQSVFEILFHKNYFEFSSFNDYFEELIYILAVLPHVRLTRKELVSKRLSEWMLNLCHEIRNIFNVHNKEQILIQKMLYLFNFLLEACIHVMEFESVKKICNVEFIVDVILPYGKQPEFVSALCAADLYFTAMKLEKQGDFCFNLERKVCVTLSENLLFPYHKIRLLTTHILSLFSNSDNENLSNSFKICFEAESISVTVHNVRDKLLLLEKLSYDFIETNDDNMEIPLRYLLGVLYENFQLLWEPVMEIISSYAKGMPVVKFWSVFQAQLTKAAEDVYLGKVFVPSNCIFSSEIITEMFSSLHSFDDRPDYSHYRILLWKSFAKFPELCEMKNRDVTPLFLSFMEEEYNKVNSDELHFCNVKQSSSESENVSKEQRESSTRITKSGNERSKFSQMYQSLVAHLCVFAKLRNPKGIYMEPKIREHYFSLLAHKNPNVQKIALDCLMAYKEKYLVPYSEHLYGLLNDKTFKTEITLFQIDKETTMVKEEHRSDLIPIVLRILYGRMLTKTGSGSGGKGCTDLRRSLVLRFLSGCHDDEMLMFLKLSFKIYLSYLKSNTKEMAEEIMRSVDLNHVITLKRLQSSVNLLQVVIEKFGALMGNEVLSFVFHVLVCIGALISSILVRKADVHTGYASGLRTLRSVSLLTIAKFFARFNYYTWNSEDIEAIFIVFVWPGLEKLPIEGIHSPTALLKFFLTWSQDPRYFKFLINSRVGSERITPLSSIMQLLAAPKIQPSVINTIMMIVEGLLTTADYSEEIQNDSESEALRNTQKAPEELNYGSKILLPHIPAILNHLQKKMTMRKKKKLSSRDVMILSRVCELVVDAETSEILLKLLFLAFLKKFDGPEQTVIHLVTTICSLLRNVSTPFNYLMSFASLFGTVTSVVARKMLLELLYELSEKYDVQDKENLLQNIQLVQDINAWDTKWVEQPDFGRRLDGFKSVIEMTEKEKIILNFGVVIVYSCFFMLRHEKDLSLKDSSGYCLRKISPFLCKQSKCIKNSQIPEIILKLITSGIREKTNESLQHEAITLLGELVRECCDTHPVLFDLKELACKEDPEVDFFNNIIHLQSHRRARALMKFCAVAKEMKKQPRTQTLTQFILPLVSSFLCEEKYTHKKNVIDAGVTCIGVVCRLLPWYHYEVVLRYYLHKLHTVPTFQKQLVCIVISILDAFHFNVSLAKDGFIDKNYKSKIHQKGCLREEVKTKLDKYEQSENNLVLQEKQKKKENIEEQGKERENTEVEEGKNVDTEIDDKETCIKEHEIGDMKPSEEDEIDDTKQSMEEELEDAIDDVENGPEESETKELLSLISEEPVISQYIKLSESAATRVIRSIVKGLLPQLQRTIGQYNKSELSHKSNRKKIAAVQEEEDTMCIPVALAIVKLLQQLPSQYLEQHLPGVFMNTCTFLKSRLESVRRVAREMLQKIMQSLGPSYLDTLLKEMIELLTKGFHIHVLIFTIHSVLSSMKQTFKAGDMDVCLSHILNICKIDLFGRAFEEKEVAKITGKVLEARSHKSYDTLHIAAQHITEKCFIDLLLPFKEVLASTNSYTLLHRVSDSLRQIVLGLNENVFVSVESLLIFIYGVTSGSIAAFQMNSEEKKDNKETSQKQITYPDTFIIPAAPRTRYGALTAKPKVSNDRNVHMLVEFGFQLFHILLKRGKATADEFGVYIEPLVPVLLRNIDTQHVKLTTTTLQCFTIILKMDVPNVRKNISVLTESLFNLLHKYATIGVSQGEYLSMVIAAFKVITVLIRDVNYHVINDTQLKALLLYVEQDMQNFTRQATAFPLLKAILSRKLDVPEIYAIMKKVAELSIISDHDHVRDQARQVFYHFLMNYPLGKKVDSHINFYLSQLRYELEPGRLSAFQITHRMIATFPDNALSNYSGIFFVTIGASLVNDESANCKKMAAKCIKTLLTRDEAGRDKLFNITLLWLKEKKIAHCQLGAQVCGIFVEVEEEKFLRNLHILLPIVQNLLITCKNFSNRPGRCVRVTLDESNDSEEVKEKKTRLKDHCIFQVLRLMKKICSLCPAFLTDSNWMHYVENVGEAAQYLLGHPHEWIRLEASTVLGHIFASIDIQLLVESLASSPNAEGRYLFNNTGSKLKSLVLDFCAQLIPETTGSQLVEQVTKNLAFLSRVMQALPEDAAMPEEDGIKISLLWMIRRMRKIVNMEIVQAPSSYLLREAVFKWLGALVVDLNRERLKSVMSQVFTPIAREILNEEDTHPDLLRLVKGVAKLIKKKIGVEEYNNQLSKAQVHLATRRAIRKKERVQEVINNPEMAAKRKIKKQQRKKLQKKRKMDEWKGRVAPKKKRKSTNSFDPEHSAGKKKWTVSAI